MPDQKLSSASTSDSNFPQNKHSPFLRRCSISDPRLDILPEKGFNPFNRVLSGLFEGGNHAFSFNKQSDSVESVNYEHQHQEHSFSAASQNRDNQQIMRAQHHKELGTNLKDSPSSTSTRPILRKSSTSIGALSPLQQNHFSTILEMAEDQGLTMSAAPITSLENKNEKNNIKIATLHSATEMAAAETPQKCKGGGFMRIFGSGGFLSKPLMHTEEENYRYIMALDR